MATFEDIRSDFEFLDEWDDRYKYLIDLGRNLEPYPDDKRDDAHKVRGCASQVWLHADASGETIVLKGDSDAHIVKGLVALLLALYSGKSASDILSTNPEAELKPFDLTDHLTPQRSNGLHSMIGRIREIAEMQSADNRP
ncbi:SufE family protein [Hyphococcus flavus]|uniref:SufE family protein n=1 Tax=Hyphococcus flavus TaxID=1866326 RepID=A0AAE9ZFZ1_9PROT|nr:SufE family protein [Hyphococcus flavus]WDI32223.1 SufE family protein [Hyphococcus flavus]